jgi:hypothetical protein
MEGKNEEGRNRGGLGIGASWVFGGERKREKKKLENQNGEKGREGKKDVKKKNKKRKIRVEREQNLSDRNKVERRCGGTGTGGAKREKIGEKMGETPEMGNEKKKRGKKKVDKLQRAPGKIVWDHSG